MYNVYIPTVHIVHLFNHNDNILIRSKQCDINIICQPFILPADYHQGISSVLSYLEKSYISVWIVRHVFCKGKGSKCNRTVQESDLRCCVSTFTPATCSSYRRRTGDTSLYLISLNMFGFNKK